MSEASQQSHIGVDLAVDPSSGIQYIRLSLAGTQYMLDVEIAASLGQSLTAISFRAAFEQMMEQYGCVRLTLDQKMLGRLWMRSDPGVVTSLLRKGLTVKQVALQTSTHPSTVRKMLQRLGITVNKKPTSSDVSVLLHAGYSYKTAGDILGMSESTTWRLAHR